MPADTLLDGRVIICDRIIGEARAIPVSAGSALVLRSAEGEDVELPADLQRV